MEPGKVQGTMPGGTAWGVGALRSNGERIYFSATSERSKTITYTEAPALTDRLLAKPVGVVIIEIKENDKSRRRENELS